MELKIPIFWTWSSTVVLFLLWCDDDTRLWSKSFEIFCSLSISPFYSVTTWQDDGSNYLNLLHPQGATLKDSGKSGLVQNEQNLEWSQLLQEHQGFKELRNCMSWIIPVWSLFCSVQVYKSLHFQPILLVKLGFHLSMF